MTVSGLTMTSADRQSGQMLHSHAQKSRSDDLAERPHEGCEKDRDKHGNGRESVEADNFQRIIQMEFRGTTRRT